MDNRGGHCRSEEVLTPIGVNRFLVPPPLFRPSLRIRKRRERSKFTTRAREIRKSVGASHLAKKNPDRLHIGKKRVRKPNKCVVQMGKKKWKRTGREEKQADKTPQVRD